MSGSADRHAEREADASGMVCDVSADAGCDGVGEREDWDWSMNEEKEFLISVIVPVYNAEAFIDRAVKSVLCQMNGSIELILVDDGSTDHSGAICDRYAADNQSITVLHKENGGTSSAKNGDTGC